MTEAPGTEKGERTEEHLVSEFSATSVPRTHAFGSLSSLMTLKPGRLQHLESINFSALNRFRLKAG